MPAFTHTSRGRTGVVGSTNPTPIVLVIIAVNVVVFFLEGFGTNDRVVDRYAMFPDGVHFLHQYYRAFTAMWLHASFTHIFFNMIALLIVGPAARGAPGQGALPRPLPAGRARGQRRLLHPQPAQRRRHRCIRRHHGRARAPTSWSACAAGCPVAPVVGLLVLNFAIGFTGNIDWRAHLGGLVTGASWPSLYDYAGELRDRNTALVLTVGGSVAVLALLGAPDHLHRPGALQSQLSSVELGG